MLSPISALNSLPAHVNSSSTLPYRIPTLKASFHSPQSQDRHVDTNLIVKTAAKHEKGWWWAGAKSSLALQTGLSPAKHSVWDHLVPVPVKPVGPDQSSMSKCFIKPLIPDLISTIHLFLVTPRLHPHFQLMRPS